MIGVLAAVAVTFVNPRAQASTARGYAQEVAALCDSVRQRAVASRTQQKLEVQANQVIHWQASEPGLLAPTSWDLVGTVPVPSQVVVSAVSTRTHIQPNDGVPPPGDLLPFDGLEFLPDGSAEAATIFITDSKSENRSRVAIYPATGSAYVYYEW